MKTGIAILLIGLQTLVLTAAADGSRDVLRLGPVGYWPADDREGNILHDRSGNENHGTIHSVPWRNGFLVFENGIYQWIQIPYREAYGAKSFSMGGWIYSGMDTKTGSREPECGAILIGQPFILAGRGSDQIPYIQNRALKWGGIWGARVDFGGAAVRLGPVSEGGVSLLEIASGKTSDVIGSIESAVAIEAERWHHVIYTYETSGKGSLYVDGKLVQSESDVPYSPSDTPLVIGGGRWGTFNLGGTISFDGSLRHMVFFDRALDVADVARLHEATHPDVLPDVIPYSKRPPREGRAPYTAGGEETPNVRQLIERVRDPQLADTTRGDAALQLAGLGAGAEKAVPALTRTLEELTAANGAHLPRVEEFFRNALIRALLDIDPQDAAARKILSEAFAKPLFDTLDTSKGSFAEIRPLLDAGQHLEALTAYKTHLESLPTLPERSGWGSSKIAEQLDEISEHLPLREEYFDRYLSRDMPFRDAHYFAYNPYDSRDGYFYTTVIERVPYEEVERQFEKELKDKTSERPEREGKTELDRKLTREWTRVKIVKISPEGNREVAYLHGDWFIYDARDAKMDGWSIVLDQEGYIHLLGGQHNRPNQKNYIPGSWERLGIAEGENRPQIMYWVSKEPGKISDFEFVGQQNNPRSISGWMNYMSFSRSRDGRLFLYGRGAMWSWAMLRYEEDARRWVNIGGSHIRMLERAMNESPEWIASLGDTVPYYGPVDALAVAWQPGAYNYCRAWSGIIRGVTFDLANRMYVQLGLFGVLEGGHVTDAMMVAYSDDLGKTFYRVDGKPLHLPLTINPIPSHNADQSIGASKKCFELWQSLVITLGCPK